MEVERLAKKREADVDEEEYKRFLECLATLTRKEKEILNLYVKGCSRNIKYYRQYIKVSQS